RIGSWSEITKGSKGTASPLADTLSSPFGIGAYAGGQSADNVNPKLKTVNIKDVSCITDGSASDLLVIAHEQKVHTDHGFNVLLELWRALFSVLLYCLFFDEFLIYSHHFHNGAFFARSGGIEQLKNL
ncbi:MAG: hypothetical protein RR889_07500, partial [Akkermansia sp.]